MSKLDLPFDVVINGTRFEAGEQVEVPKELVDGVQEIVAAHKEALEVQTTHRGAVAAEVEEPKSAEKEDSSNEQ